MKELGFIGKVTELIGPDDLEGFELGRVVVQYRERFVVHTMKGVFLAQITGNLRYAATNRGDFPAVGDWVKLTMMNHETAIILEVFPRVSKLERQAVGTMGETQLIATNIDYAFIVQSVGQDFNLNRMERYLSICYSSGIQPIILLTKTDLAEKARVDDIVETIRMRIKGITILPVSSKTKHGYDHLKQILKPFTTYCFLGSSGVGKSTIVNHIAGQQILKTDEISASTNKGKHTTSQRELIILPNKSIVIDTPGMREIGITDDSTGIEKTYDQIEALGQKCKFNDCTHTNEVGCAVIAAVNDGEISQGAYNNFLKLKREHAHFSTSVAQKRRKGKEFGKMQKAVVKQRKRDKF